MIEPTHFRNVPDWPKPGIQFKDIGPILADPELLAAATDALTEAAAGMDVAPDLVVAPEARGFLFGPAIANSLGAGFVPARKEGKLPPETHSVSYELEYGEDHLHVAHGDLTGRRVLLHDDLLATGGTVAALASLVRDAGAVPVGALFLSELAFLRGRERLASLDVLAVVTFDD